MLTDTTIRHAKSKEKQYKLSDSGGLHIIIKPTGSKLFYQKYRFGGKEKSLALGAYPAISLATARILSEDVKALLMQGIDPSKKRRQEKIIHKTGERFSQVADVWLEAQCKLSGWSESYLVSQTGLVERYLKPDLGDQLLIDLKTKDLLFTLNKVIELGYLDTATRVKQCLTSIMRYGVQKGIIEYNPAHDLANSLPKVKTQHYPALPLVQLPDFFNRLNLYSKGRARFVTLSAIKLFLNTFIRSSEMRLGRWDEIDFESAMWVIPDEREKIEGVSYSYRGAKMSEYLVPLSSQSLEILGELKSFTGDNTLIFPCLGRPDRPLSENTINQALRRMGYDTKTEICCHGFRTMACTALNESRLWTEDAIERQMSHQERNSVRAAYLHKAKYIKERRQMMQWWSDYLDANQYEYIPPYEFKGNH